MKSVDTALRRGNMHNKVSLADVALAAGVSLGTASKALSGKPGVSDRTREKINQTASQLRYSPNPIAQTLALGKSDSIGIVTTDLQGIFSNPIMVGAQRELSASGVTVLLANAGGDSKLERRCIESLLQRNVDGLLIVDPTTNARPPIQIDVQVPVVYAYAVSSDPRDCSITSDNVNAGHLAVEHLLKLGRRSIAVICGDAQFKASVDRLQGALDALEANGLKPVNLPRFGTWFGSWAYEEIGRLVESGTSFDGVICQSDVLAMGALDRLKTAGLRIPEEVAVIGHDNWESIVVNTTPQLSSISNSLEDIGHLAAKRLTEKIEGNSHCGVEYVPCVLTQRASTVA